jgi:hypothetical protein
MVKNIWEKPVKSMDHIEILNIKLKRFKKHREGWGAIFW